MTGKLLWTGILLVVAGCCALAGLNVYQMTALAPRIAQGRQLVVHTFDVISTAQSLAQALDDAERGQRSFIITGDTNYLSIYRAAIGSAPALYSRLKELTAGNPDQQPVARGRRRPRCGGAARHRALAADPQFELASRAD